MSKSADAKVRAILKEVKSDKITERQHGLQAIREYFSRDNVCDTFHEYGVVWLEVFQALFEAVVNEKMAFLKQVGKATSSAATARRRLTDAANTVRWLVERAVQFQNNTAVKALLDHIYRTMMYKKDLLEPVALDYIKALKCLLEYTPHLDRLDVNKWVGIAEMAFNVILGDPIKSSFSDDAAESCASPTAVPMEVDDSEFFLENEDESESSSATSPSKKRRRTADTATPGPSSVRSRSPVKPRRNKVPSKEQNELVPILSLLLRSSSAPLLFQDVAYLPSAILRRLQKFLEIYPADASLYYDYLLTLLYTLSHLSLNRKDHVVRFAQASWDGLVGLWGTKNKGMKECLAAVLRILFPFLTAHDKSRASPYDWSAGIGQLWRLLDGEAESRWGVDGLSLECLRLEVPVPEDGNSCAFMAQTFRAGYNFDTAQALAWAILELQADCAEKLFQHSESIHSHSVPSTRNGNKRTRVENPISSLLDSIQHQRQSHVRAYHLQTLLFFIDRHWSVLHDTLQQTVFSTLIQFISFDDPLVQSWTFLCFAAIAYCDTHSRYVSRNDAPVERDWDTIWTHAMRRINVPSVSRAACQTAYVLLLHSHSHSHSSSRLALTPQRLLPEIESLAKDLDVQGPPFPYDSVCAFLSQALRVASQDVRLYRMQFEEKALSWVVDCWTVRDAGSMPLHTVADVMRLLETICGFSKKTDLFCRVTLPECLIVETLIDQGKTKVIRDYLLTATLPEFHQVEHRPLTKALEPPPTGSAAEHRRLGDDPLDQGPREKKISVFLLKSLEALSSDFASSISTNTHPTAEQARKSLDWAVTALSFESLLSLNGIRPNRRVIQAACKLMLLVAPLLKDRKWTDSERALVLLAFEPLTSTGEMEDDDVFTTALLPPDVGSGIKAETLRLLTSGGERREEVIARRLDLQRLICKSADVQDGFEAVTKILRFVLGALVGTQGSNEVDMLAPDRDFVTQSADRATGTRESTAANSSVRCIAEVSIAFLAVIPILQSASGEPTNDRELTELVLHCAETPNETSLLVCRIFLSHVRQNTLALSKPNFDSLMENLDTSFFPDYRYARSELTQMTIVHFLDCTLHIWSVADSERAQNARKLCKWISGALRAGQETRTHIRSWKVRDALARFYARYLVQDPSQASWYDEVEDHESAAEGLPYKVLPAMNRDHDIRVRFRAAALSAHLFAVGRRTGLDAATVYAPISQSYPRELNRFEDMLTRLLSLGNMMIVSSAVRHGAYWHLLEASLHTTQYTLHTEAILRGVSQRLGLPIFSGLFEAYAAQLAFTIKIRGADFLRFRPSLLGYKDRKECAEANFLAFTPTNLLAEHDRQTGHVGRKLFEGHCKVIQKPISEGIRDCFADIVGYQILQALLSIEAGQMSTDDLKCLLIEKTMSEETPAEFHNTLLDNVDGVVSWIVRTLGDQDFRSEGPIVAALEAVDPSGKTAIVFRALVRHRKLEDFETHAPNVPSFSSSTVLQALSWFDALVPDADVKATAYHVTHALFASIQRSPLVNEQLRLINALCLWVAFRYDTFQNTALLHALTRGATSLMAQSDLARAAQSMLEWVFDCYRTSRIEHPRLTDVLIRICCFANDYARKSPTSPLHVLGQDLRSWIDAQVLTLSTVKSKSLKACLTRALSAWPHTPSPRLAELFSSITSADLSTVLSDPSIVSNKFRLVRQLLNHARGGYRDPAQFSETDFWRLRECIPSSEQLQDEDLDAFAGLLIIHEGQLSSFGSEQPSILGKRRDASSGALPQPWIIQVLLNMLEASDASQVHVAYQTLRSVMSVSAANVPTELRLFQDELAYLQAYKRTPKTRPARQLEELLTSEAYMDAVGEFPRWVGMIATLLSDILSIAEPFYAQLALILQSDAAFTEQTLPFLVHTLLESERLKVVPDQSRKKQPKSLVYRKTLSDYFTAVLKSDAASMPCVRSIVDIVLHLRHFNPQAEKDALAYDKWLAIDYTLLARNSIRCGAYTTSLLFLELAVEYAGDTRRDEGAAEQILYEIYSHIDEPDGFYGIKTQDLHQFLIKRFHHEKQWEKAFRFHSAALEAGSTETAEADGLLQSFHSFGFNHLAIDTLQSSSFGTGTTFNSPGMNYRLGWRTETWDLPERKGEGNPGAPLYNALRAVYRERNPRVIQAVVRDSVSEEMGRLRALGSENLAEIRDAAQNLMCLNQVAQWFQTNTQTRLTSREADMSQWTEFVNLEKGFDFGDFENVMATRISLVHSVRRKEEQRPQIGDMVSPFSQCLLDVEKQCLIRLSQAARDARQVQIALNSIIRAQRLERSPSFKVSEEFASVLRLHSEEKLAVQFLKELDLTHLPHSEKGVILARLGTWMAEARLENPTDISSRYFEPAASYINRFQAENPKGFTASHAKVYHQYAIFAEHQYKVVNTSPDSIRWRVYIERKRQEVKLRKTQGGSTEKMITDAEKLLEGDKEAYRKHNSARETFLAHAIEMYSRALEASDAFDGDGAIRLCSLWFENFNQTECDFQENVRRALDRIPSRKLVFLAHQLSARLSKTDDPSQETLESVVLRMCMDHPFHSLYQVYCLLPYGQQQATSNRRQSRHISPGTQTARSESATEIFNRLRGDPQHERRTRDVELVASACLEWAKFKIGNTERDPKNKPPKIQTIPSHLAIRKIAGVGVPVLTSHTPLDPSSKYDSCAFISKFETTFELCGGVNLPKVCICVGVDGARYKQLFKGEGNDDLRQDAVMAQVFELCNIVLKGDRETARRSLSVRSYRIIPLGMQAGVLEFVANTTPLHSWVGPAHHKYNRHEMKALDATRNYSASWKEHSGEPAKLLVLYQEFKATFHPVLRHFFTEKHKTPMAWFAMRLNYIRSVATTSIVGHVLGLGDRHGSNILLDCETGEMVHIDLGIAFDQGKLLKVPEMVPFRMTADVVDGMGAAGTQGVFQRCAEETLRVLREGSEVIMTVLEVFKHDPLHSWTASEIKLKRVQGGTDTGGGGGGGVRQGPPGIGIDMASGTADEAADRALTSVARKLDKAMSVEYTVNELLAQATDPMRLATIYHGWGAIF